MLKALIMRVWTIQTEFAWESLEAEGVWYSNWSFVDPDFKNAYQWMTRQLTDRIGPPPTPEQAPVWVWSQWCGGACRPIPDLRSSGHLTRGSKAVRLELEVDDRLVLLSDFNLWHYALNYWYLPANERDGDAFDAALATGSMNYHETKPLPDSVLHARIEESWQQIFDLDWDDPAFTGPREEKMIQGVLWELRRDQVRRVKSFVAR